MPTPVNQSIKDWLENNQVLIDEVCAPLKAELQNLLQTEDSSFHEMVRQEYNAYIRYTIAVECAKSLAISPLEIELELEDCYE